MKRSPNTVKMREIFSKYGFDFYKEMIQALQEVDSITKLEALTKLAPYFIEKLAEQPEIQPQDPRLVNPVVIPKSISKASDEELLKLAAASTEPDEDE